MKKLLYPILACLPIITFGQGWVGTANGLHAINSNLQVFPLNVGIGTSVPTANFQVHGTVQFSHLEDDNLLEKVLVGDRDGYLFWRDVSTLGTNNAWLLTGNTGTNSNLNFLGTTDYQGLKIKTNNINRFIFDPGVTYGSNNIGYVSVSEYSAINTSPGQLSVFGKDIPGNTMPLGLHNTRDGQTWSHSPGPNNTMGRHIRLAQFFSNTTQSNQFYDMGIGQDSCFFITQHGLSGTGGYFPKRMITISPSHRVGLNMNWSQSPTANFHTVGTARFENLPSGAGNILVVDNNGNVFKSSQLTLEKNIETPRIQELETQIREAMQEIEKLKQAISELSKRSAIVEIDERKLLISPNPSNGLVNILFSIKENEKGSLIIYSINGAVLRTFDSFSPGPQQITLFKGELAAGTYLCTLRVNNTLVKTEKFILAS